MIENDTVKLLRECDAGIKMGVSSIDDVLPHVKSRNLEMRLNACKDGHERLREDLEVLLDKCHDDGKEPTPIAKGMSWMKSNVKLSMKDTDATVADLMTEGCNMGVKSLSRYLNQYTAASEDAKTLCKKIITLEDDLVKDIRSYL